MQCPFCGKDDDKVIDSRSSEGGTVVRRRRSCLACDRRFTTYERVEEAVRMTIRKKDGTREPYQREKILAGLERACSKRPIGDADFRRILERVEDGMQKKFDREGPSDFIGDVIGGCLREIDKVAYVRFASVYRNFEDVGELIVEAERVRKDPVVGPKQKDLFEKKN